MFCVIMFWHFNYSIILASIVSIRADVTAVAADTVALILPLNYSTGLNMQKYNN